jgi:hypothetical protein
MNATAQPRRAHLVVALVVAAGLVVATGVPAGASGSTQAGYIAGTTTSHPFVSVTATVKIPKLTCPASTTEQLYSDVDLHDVFGGAAGDQSSAQTLWECSKGAPVYAAAALSYKAGVGLTNVTIFSFKPKAGDVVTESVTNTATGSIVTVVDHTTGASGTKTYPRFAAVNAQVALLQSSTPVPNFGSAPFTLVKVNGTGMGTQPHLLKTSTTAISVSAFSNGGTAFTENYV